MEETDNAGNFTFGNRLIRCRVHVRWLGGQCYFFRLKIKLSLDGTNWFRLPLIETNIWLGAPGEPESDAENGYNAWGDRINISVERIPADEDSDDGVGTAFRAVAPAPDLEEGNEDNEGEESGRENRGGYHPDSDAGLDPSELYPSGASDTGEGESSAGDDGRDNLIDSDAQYDPSELYLSEGSAAPDDDEDED